MEQAIFSVLPQRTIQASLQFEFCGFSKTLDHHSFGPAVRDLYILHLVLDGEGMYTVKNKQYSLKKGDFFLIRPYDTTFYSSSIKDPWSYIWLAFSGATADQIITKSCLERDYYVASTTNITPYISTIQACLELDHSDLIQELKLTELTYRFLALFVQDAVNSEPNIAQKVSPLIL
ncbi:AraC family ligand binding domain-containing protein [Enterococcus bulliens]